MRPRRRYAVLAAAALLAGCASSARPTAPASASERAAPAAKPLLDTAFATTAADEDLAIAALVPDTPINVTLPPQPTPQFLNTVLGQLLKLPYSLGPQVASRRELIALSTGGDISRRAFFRVVRNALRDYGLRLRVAEGAVRVIEDSTPTSRVAAVLRARASAETPENLRTVATVVPLAVLAANDVGALLRSLLPDGSNVEIKTDVQGNLLVLSGPAGEIPALLDLVRELDTPTFQGAQAIQLSSGLRSPEAFARALANAAAADSDGAGAAVARPLRIMPLPGRGEIMVFVKTREQALAVQRWAAAAEQSDTSEGRTATFVYRPRFLEAQALGSLVSTAISTPHTIAAVPVGVPGAPPATTDAAVVDAPRAPAGAVATGGAVVVDTIGNRLVFTGAPAEYARLRPVLEALDTPPGQVMVEVVVAEVTLTDATRVGLEWFFRQSQSNGVFSGGTEDGLGLKGGGLSLSFVGPDLRAAFNAFASNNNVNILSRPKLVTRSGTEAEIQVGADVPIITSQTAANVQSGGDTDVLQTVQYRQTGVILKIKPIVYAGDRVDLQISQEVSSQQPNSNAAISSPLFLNRSAKTSLSLTDGATGVLGGLMDDNLATGNTGVPVLKDVPLLGSAFRADTASRTRTELVILVTPFIIREPTDLAAMAKAMVAGAERAYSQGLRAYTLSPRRPDVIVLDPPPVASQLGRP